MKLENLWPEIDQKQFPIRKKCLRWIFERLLQGKLKIACLAKPRQNFGGKETYCVDDCVKLNIDEVL